MSENSEKLFGLAGEFDNNISYPKSMETRRYISSTLILAGKEIESLEAENAALQQQVDALQQRVHLCAGYDALEAENAARKINHDRLTEMLECYQNEGATRQMDVRVENATLKAENAALREQCAALAEHLRPGVGWDGTRLHGQLNNALIMPPQEQKNGV